MQSAGAQKYGRASTAQQGAHPGPAAPPRANTNPQVDYWSLYNQRPSSSANQQQHHTAQGHVQPSHGHGYPQPSVTPAGANFGANPHAMTLPKPSGVEAKPSAKPRSNAEVRLWDNHGERQLCEWKADLFATFKTAELLERAWTKSSISDDDYTREMWKLINQFKNLRAYLQDSMLDVRRFLQEYNMEAPAAIHRLLVIGTPATVEFGDGSTVKEKEKVGKLIAVIVASFINAMDALKLNLLEVDQIQPLILEVVSALNRMELTNYSSTLKMKEWLSRLNSMRAVDRMSDDDVRQLSHDLEKGFAEFHAKLEDI
eukprot:CAMPEP_0185829188 /NCGR_PEP_ID=MMETSP1353-20130828/98_1 /TAXON_ID=1077150 /ORGANISM="Erythrolobus australicus, Strain CCMP3124" /LENGTH=313 /DNA_ID=CAMNT_0028526949 /DNA_START=39 /DNA_END=980 /DNA_ORIENTATION=+